MKQQEKLIQDMERAVYRREAIQFKSDIYTSSYLSYSSLSPQILTIFQRGLQYYNMCVAKFPTLSSITIVSSEFHTGFFGVCVWGGGGGGALPQHHA